VAWAVTKEELIGEYKNGDSDYCEVKVYDFIDKGTGQRNCADNSPNNPIVLRHMALNVTQKTASTSSLRGKRKWTPGMKPTLEHCLRYSDFRNVICPVHVIKSELSVRPGSY
jgi:hypothetical protein